MSLIQFTLAQVSVIIDLIIYLNVTIIDVITL